MLSQNTIDVVKSTAPILQEHGETLTRHFYQRMFSHNPEVAPYFNQANQAEGTQQRALAGAVCAYAANIDNLEVLGGAVELIAQKHASLMIKPEHYPIVGENLLASIREVLGEGATDEVINAWAEAYGFLAEILIGRETQIYDSNSDKEGGWDGFRNFRVEKKEAESSNITSFYLKPEDNGALPVYLPGQYITLRLATADGSTTMRNFSLSDKPGQDYLRISVKREAAPHAGAADGYVSNKLHDEIEVGGVLEVGPPCGEFFLNLKDRHERPLVLLAAGVGITPLLSILTSAIDSMPDREIIFIHGCLNEEVQAFKKTIDELAESHSNLKIHYRYSDQAKEGVDRSGNCSTGLVDAELIESFLPDRHADYYFCGPKPFMINIYHDLLKWGLPGTQVHFEFFGPREELQKAD
ncbi:NO-inducible flavohemoprotein [Emcibacter sp.]|uniref:NO-inducible flavohemoprotein n=1 Tax=Emcibacter sp. TaxID=1979954 RepID=UPI002AA78695|nr:NO-inducible flavohemoprotein [Emcibacter sp.]